MQQIFVGDVQGCADELEEMLARAGSVHGDDFELWLVGDLINRGPGNLPALRRVRDLVEQGRASYILGNHEINFLNIVLGLRELRETDTVHDVLDAPDLDDWVEWLRRRPIALTGRIGETPFAMVHASVHPKWDLETLEARAHAIEARLGHDEISWARELLAAGRGDDEDRDALGRFVSCRSIETNGEWSPLLPSKTRKAWHAGWRRRKHRYGIVYGHWALQGLHVAPGLRGLDTGCVHHGRDHDGFLTAWLPSPGAADAFAVPDEAFWQVKARRPYYHEHLGQHPPDRREK